MTTVILAPSFGGTILAPEQLATHPIYGTRPLLRGRLHQAAAMLSIPVGAYVIESAVSPARPAASIYAATWALMLTTSAAYHRLAQGLVARFWMRRLDHSMILVHIAGSTTPIALSGVGGVWGVGLLVVSWSVAVVGVALKLTGLTHEHDPGAWAFPVLGWLPLLALPSLAGRAGAPAAFLLLAAVVTYTLGAICFARKQPNPVPMIFGYHEVWHLFTLIAGTLQVFLTLLLVSP